VFWFCCDLVGLLVVLLVFLVGLRGNLFMPCCLLEPGMWFELVGTSI